MPLMQINTILSHWFKPHSESNPESTVPETDAYPLSHVSGNNFFWFTILPPSTQVIISKCAVETLTINNVILLLE